MIRQALTIAFCALVFTMALMISPARAGHPVMAPYVCSDMEGVEITLAYIAADDMDELKKRAQSDRAFNCYLIPMGSHAFVPVEIVREYVQEGVNKGVLLTKNQAGASAYIFGPLNFILAALHATAS